MSTNEARPGHDGAADDGEEREAEAASDSGGLLPGDDDAAASKPTGVNEYENTGLDHD